MPVIQLFWDLFTTSYQLNLKAGIVRLVYRSRELDMSHISSWFSLLMASLCKQNKISPEGPTWSCSLSSIYLFLFPSSHFLMFSLAFSAPATLSFLSSEGPWPFSPPGMFFRSSHGHLLVIHFLAAIALPPGKLLYALSKIPPNPAT